MFSAGCATTYFAVQACSHLRRDERTRIHVLLGWILAYWAVANMKDLVQAVPGWYNRQTLNYIMLADGWSAITFACFLFELTMPGWVTRKHVALLCLPFAGFTLAYLAKPGNTILYLYTAFLSAFGLFILAIGYAKAKKHLEFIKENYSNIDEIDISWIRRVYVVAFLNQSLWLLVSLIGEAFTDMLYYLSSILLWQMIVNNCRNLKQIRPSQNSESNDMEMTPERTISKCDSALPFLSRRSFRSIYSCAAVLRKVRTASRTRASDMASGPSMPKRCHVASMVMIVEVSVYFDSARSPVAAYVVSARRSRQRAMKK